ncbi:Qat anti-phage system ATPase QatA [uncultured Desulfosarcina sp.]|uniref:Qat anti-phage system ATPase QatA n=1 Tax=uncultured Desulfosarcina sp. TaxID=218289 RepID=UPI0029C67DA7|nr:Qat anti-phage system ATPase QatA [uncultured Desulfosarcina sp.]
MFLADNETKIDLLNNEAIAETIIKLVREHSDYPITIGVHGDWGAGKSSILEMIEADFEGDEKVLCLKFNGWRFQGFEDAKIALIEGIISGLIEKRSMLTKTGEAVKSILRRIDWLKVAKKSGGLAFTAFTGFPAPDQIQGVIGMLEGLFADPTKMANKENLATTLQDVKGLLKAEAEVQNVPEEVNSFLKEFDDLLSKAGVDQLIVLIDDLDRCLPDIAIETLEAIRLLVFTSRTAFVIAADEAMIEYAVRKHFPDLPDTTGPQTYARNYLEKLIQVPFRIPSLGETETRIYVTLLLVGAELGEEDYAFRNLISASREKLRRPWRSGALDAATVKKALGGKVELSQRALMLSDQIGPILASGTKGNPRQIKRFLNTLSLRKRTAEARGFGDEVKFPILAKLMLAERFIPRFFDQIAEVAAAAPDGKCQDLFDLESAVLVERSKKTNQKGPDAKENTKTESETSPSPKLGTVNSTTSAILNEWLSSPSIKEWANVQPPIGNDDLRPYLFVAKERKDYFGSASVLGHLAAIADNLLGSKFAVQAMKTDLKRLAPPEAMQVFELLRGRIVGSDSFDVEPTGAAGLAVLVKAQPTLQDNLLDFLEALPPGRLGPWACSGWEGVINTIETNDRFDRVLRLWGKNGAAMLRVAAKGVLRTRKGG